MAGTHNGPPNCLHGKPMKRDTCQQCINIRNERSQHEQTTNPLLP